MSLYHIVLLAIFPGIPLAVSGIWTLYEWLRPFPEAGKR